ncbi:MAG: PH domain-containing protein [Phycisphaerales bacterium]|nr:PH domain-containing protein [Phycisphaerales bacterium]MCI0674244.1 PH domain-containing protein [Phycisphaerales bacterium]
MPSSPAFNPSSITRPDPALRTYYFIVAALTVFGFPFVILPLLFKYYTLRYQFDDKGVSMSWGVLFHLQTYLTYRRIQDIHVTRNIIHRWLGLAAVAIQTAAGSSDAEMTVEGIRNPESLRDFLYHQMRGAKDDPVSGTGILPVRSPSDSPAAISSDNPDESLTLLHEILEELRRLRESRVP